VSIFFRKFHVLRVVMPETAVDRLCDAIRDLSEEGGSHLKSIQRYLKDNGKESSGLIRAVKKALAQSRIRKQEDHRYTLVLKTPKKHQAKIQPPVDKPLSGQGDSTRINGVTVTLLGREPPSGRFAEIDDVVSIQYKGLLKENMKPFDQGSLTFRLGRKEVIAGLDIGIAGMREGEKRRFDIPSRLGYGKKGYRKTIPPNSELVFFVQLSHVKKPHEFASKSRARQAAKKKR